MTQVAKKKFEMPHIYILLSLVIAIAAVLTWVLPAGEFERVEIEVNGRARTVVVPGTWHQVEQRPVGPFRAVMAIYDGMVNAGDIIFFIFISFAAIGLLLSTGAFNGLVAALLRVFKGKSRAVIIPVFMTLFGILASVIGVSEEALPFVPLFVGISIAMGYDAIVGCAIVSLACAIGYAGAAMNPFTVGIAQGIAQLPPLSGAWYRIICHAVMLVVACVYTIRYALKIQAVPQASIVYGEVDVKEFGADEKTLSETKFGLQQKLVLLVFLATIAVFVWGTVKLDWYFGEIATAFLIMAVVVGVIMRWSPNDIAGKIAVNFGTIAMACMMVGIARGIKVVLESGHVIDTVVYGMSVPLQKLPTWLAGEAMLVIQTLLNFLIPSGSGQAMVSMPIMAPLSDILGISRQVAVLAFQFGDGLTNVMWPTTFAPVIAALAGIKLERWWAWFGKLFLLLVLTQAVLIAIAIAIGY